MDAKKTATYTVTDEGKGYKGHVCIDNVTGTPCTCKQYTAPDSSEQVLHDVPQAVMIEAEEKGYIVQVSGTPSW